MPPFLVSETFDENTFCGSVPLEVPFHKVLTIEGLFQTSPNPRNLEDFGRLGGLYSFVLKLGMLPSFPFFFAETRWHDGPPTVPNQYCIFQSKTIDLYRLYIHISNIRIHIPGSPKSTGYMYINIYNSSTIWICFHKFSQILIMYVRVIWWHQDKKTDPPQSMIRIDKPSWRIIQASG